VVRRHEVGHIIAARDEVSDLLIGWSVGRR